MSNQLQVISENIYQMQPQFESVRADDAMNFRREAEFALQIIQGNSFTQSVAMRNPQSLQDAITNVAALNVTLNPAEKHAYLVPRDGKICLDISARGMLAAAIDCGSILWGQVKIVYAKDDYENTGISSEPIHKYIAFGDRGAKIGAYCVVKTPTGDYLTHEMQISDIYRIRERSQSYKKGSSSPWKTDEDEMIRKTVVKQASKYWPKSERMAAMAEYMNRNGEGIDFKSEQRGPTEVSADQLSVIRALLEETGTDPVAILAYASGALFSRSVDQLEQMTSGEAVKIIGALEMKKAAMAKSGGAK